MKHKCPGPYSVSQGKRFFDWNAFLARKTILSREWDMATELSGYWVTCACGNMCTIIPRQFHCGSGGPGLPEDLKLRQLGIDFNSNIIERDRTAAKNTLTDIEARSVILIDRELEKLSAR